MIAGIDIAKFIFSIFVVGIHTQPFEQNTGVIKNVVDFLFSISVPFFFLSSSYFLFSKPINSPLELHHNINKYALRLTKLYLMWTAIFLPVTLYDYWTNGKSALHNTFSFFRMLIMVGEHYFSWPLWYLLASIYGIIFLKLLINRKYALPIAAFSLLLLSEFLTHLARGEIAINLHTQTAMEIIQHTISNGRILSGLPYLAAGYYLSRPLNRYATLTFYALGAIGCVLCALKISYISTISMLPVCAAVFLATKNIKPRSSEIYLKLRKASTVIYFTHMYFYFIMSFISRNFHWYGWTPFISTTCCSLAFALLVIKTDKKFRVLKFIFG